MRWFNPMSRLDWFAIRWPREVEAEQVSSALTALAGVSTPWRRHSLVLATVGWQGVVGHVLAVPASRPQSVEVQLESAVPGLTLVPLEPSPLVFNVDRCWRAVLSTSDRPLNTANPQGVARALLSALGSTGKDETLMLRWVLGPVKRPAAVEPRAPGGDPWGVGLPEWAMDIFRGPERSPQALKALADKRGAAGWRAALHLGVIAQGRRRQRQLLGSLAAAVRAAEAPDVRFRFRRARRSVMDRMPRRRPCQVNVNELAGLVGWPIGTTSELPVPAPRSRLVAAQTPPHPQPEGGRVVAEGTHPKTLGPLRLEARDALHHLHVVGPTGVGKSTVLLNLICQDMAAGRSVVVVDPHGDLVTQVLRRVPDERVDDVVVIDPTDPEPVGLNPLAARNVPASVKADHLLEVFKKRFANHWGPRTEDIMYSGLRTLALADEDASLASLPDLFGDDSYRRPLAARVSMADPFGLRGFWKWFEGLGDEARAQALAPVMNKLRTVLLRDSVRRIVGQPRPRFHMADVFRNRRVLLVNLAKGQVGEEAAMLLGGLVVSSLWQTTQARTAIAQERRHPVMVFLDEFQTYLALPTDVGDVLTQARGLGVGLTLAHQHLHQLTTDVRHGVLGNARSRVVFAAHPDDANVLVRPDPRLTPADAVALGKYAVYASLLTDGEAAQFASGRTLPPPPAVRTGADVRQRSREQWGRPAGVVDAEMHAQVDTSRSLRRSAHHRGRGGEFGQRRRKSA
jgi:uncharacterized protein DUF87